MTALLALQAVAVALLALLVVGLLRSHAEIVRTLHRLGAGIGDEDEGGLGAAAAGASPVSMGPARRVPPAAASAGIDLAGATPEGDPIEVAVRPGQPDTLVAFLSSSCSTCAQFWHDLRRPAADLGLPGGTRLVLVTKGAGHEDAARIAALAPAGHLLVMSTEAWHAYGVPVTPYFLHVDGATGAIVGQGSGHSWAQVASLLGRAVGDAATRAPARQRVAESEADIDRRLLAAGITPGDPRLYHPTPPPEAEE